ncbi:MAG: hypothetical protein V4858_09070 [Pseudomonadota bacterium]
MQFLGQQFYVPFLRLWNATKTFYSTFQFTGTANRTHTLQDRDGTLADLGAQTFDGAQRGVFKTLADASTIAVDLSLGNNFRVVLGGNRTLGTPTNGGEGQQGVISPCQDATGSRALAYTWFWTYGGGFVGILSTTAFTFDMLSYTVNYWLLSTFTVTSATPGVFTVVAHGMVSGRQCQLSTTGALYTGLSAATTYFVHVIDANTFHLSTSMVNLRAGTYVATSGSQSGVHTIHCAAGTLSLLKATP